MIRVSGLAAVVLLLGFTKTAACAPRAPQGDDVTYQFDCATAPEFFGHPGAEVVSCGPFYGSERLWFVWLRTDSADVRRLALLGDGEPFTGTGLAATGRYLVEGDLHHNAELTEDGALWLLKLGQGYPPGWSAMDGAGEFEGIGKGTTFSANPFHLVLIRRVDVGPRGSGPRPEPPPASPLSQPKLPISGPGPSASPGPGYMPPVDLFERAVLEESPAGWFEWTVSSRSRDGAWAEDTRIPLK